MTDDQDSSKTWEDPDRGAVVGHGIVLTGSALVPLGLVVTICGTLVGTAWWVNDEIHSAREAIYGELASVRQEILSVRDEVADLSLDLRLARTSRFTQIDAKFWAQQFATLNPLIKVPEPVHIQLPGEGDGETVSERRRQDRKVP